jgi:hypothetical protein
MTIRVRQHRRNSRRQGFTQDVQIGRSLGMCLDGDRDVHPHGTKDRSPLRLFGPHQGVLRQGHVPPNATFRSDYQRGNTRLGIFYSLLHANPSQGFESSADIYKRRSVESLSFKTRSFVLHASPLLAISRVCATGVTNSSFGESERQRAPLPKMKRPL